MLDATQQKNTIHLDHKFSLLIHFSLKIYSAKVFEEEDFDPRDYNYVLTPDIANTKACFMLKEAEDELVKKAKSENLSGEIPEVNKYHITLANNYHQFIILFA